MIFYAVFVTLVAIVLGLLMLSACVAFVKEEDHALELARSLDRVTKSRDWWRIEAEAARREVEKNAKSLALAAMPKRRKGSS